MKLSLKAFFTNFFVVVFFIVVALAYFHPVLQGKGIYQSDIAQYTGMAKERNDLKEKTGEESYWTNSAFGGMPTYQLGANYPHNYVKQLDRLIRFLPRPADYLFLYFIGFYILLSCLKVDYKLAIVGALAFGFSTYLILIIGAGHNAKAHAMGYLPILLGGILLTFRKKYLLGFVITALAMALEISANHYQMTYYFMLLVLILGATYLIDAIVKKKLKHFFITVGILIFAVAIGIGANTTGLITTKEYADWSTRGKSELTIAPDGSPKENTNGLSKAYITHWSYGITESLNLFVPRLFGGSDNEYLGAESKTYQYFIDKGLPRKQASNFYELPLYWGSQPGTSGPAYIGAVIFFLFILGLFLVKGKLKWWLVGGTLMSLLLSWGKNFSLLTDFMIDYFPLYDKFRAVSSIQVVLELCAPIMAIMALVALFKKKKDTTKKITALKFSFAITFGLGILLFLIKGNFDFIGRVDATYSRYYGPEVGTMLQLDREAIYTSDTIRYLIYIVLVTVALWLYLKAKIKEQWAIIVVGLLIVVDLVGVAQRYVNEEDFISQRRIKAPFQQTPLDQQLLQDTSIFRVFDQSEGLNGSRTSYFHQSIGGYHAAKPSAINDLFDYHVYQGNIKVLSMLNVKYVIQQDEEGNSVPAINPDALGNAWFIEKLIPVKSGDEEIQSLEKFNPEREAVVNTNTFTAINRFEFQKDSTALIEMVTYKPNHLVYATSNENAGIGVFSEMYYAQGWNAYIDGVLKPHFKVNYALRALRIPEGKHTVEFKFEPEIVQKGSKISLLSSILFVLLAAGGAGYKFWRSKKTIKDQ